MSELDERVKQVLRINEPIKVPKMSDHLSAFLMTDSQATERLSVFADQITATVLAAINQIGDRSNDQIEAVANYAADAQDEHRNMLDTLHSALEGALNDIVVAIDEKDIPEIKIIAASLSKMQDAVSQEMRTSGDKMDGIAKEIRSLKTAITNQSKASQEQAKAVDSTMQMLASSMADLTKAVKSTRKITFNNELTEAQVTVGGR